ncbi:DUF1016 N-terminal domain-containing protein [Denitratisoma oestradiolicum]|uniref:YhcG N-terminal domain-containing protein n=1 Tax=Denitratisoma oestradiolicum TaxID=311182 RepID=A0A6S6XW16_9PROT|nr:DUF1016 N-terminal domain-containing protein [Denitratisoma oestradiolicum]CAB1368423.1 protein of unknown function [Denitratisoma oestradiolicum]
MNRVHRQGNFSELKAHDAQLERLGLLAERYFADDPNTCLLKLRQLAECIAQSQSVDSRGGERLAQEFGRGGEAKNLRRMVQFAQACANGVIVATLSRQLSWSHVVALLPLKSAEARLHYTEQAAQEHWSVRELRDDDATHTAKRGRKTTKV